MYLFFLKKNCTRFCFFFLFLKIQKNNFIFSVLFFYVLFLFLSLINNIFSIVFIFAKMYNLLKISTR
jgi:hypothetical protein